MVTTLSTGTRKARRAYRCGLCNIAIKPGDRYSFQVNVYDGRIYTWRDCLACDRDGIVNYVSDWDGGWADEGIDYEKAVEWAEQAVEWPKHWLCYNRPILAVERFAARNWLARACARGLRDGSAE